jgi:hypothetical protein
MAHNTAESLRDWATRHPGALAELSELLADALESSDRAALWAQIDIRREFQIVASKEKALRWLDSGVLASSPPSIRNSLRRIVGVLRVLLPVTYLAPVAFTWWHLRGALSSFSRISLSEGESTDFLQYWSGSTDYSGMLLQDVALGVFVMLAVIAGLHFAVSAGEEGELDVELSGLLLGAQLELAKSRAVTPQELSDSMSRAAQLLSNAATTAANSLETVAGVSDNMASAAETLSYVSQSLTASAQQIATSVEPLIALPRIVQETVKGLQVLPGQLAEVQDQIESSTENLARAAEAIRSIGQSHDLVAGQSQQLLDSLRDLNTRTSSSLDAASQASVRIKELYTYVESQKPSVAIMGTLVEDMKLVYASMNRIAEEFKAAADTFQRANEDYRRQSE